MKKGPLLLDQDSIQSSDFRPARILPVSQSVRSLACCVAVVVVVVDYDDDGISYHIFYAFFFFFYIFTSKLLLEKPRADSNRTLYVDDESARRIYLFGYESVTYAYWSVCGLFIYTKHTLLKRPALYQMIISSSPAPFELLFLRPHRNYYDITM